MSTTKRTIKVAIVGSGLAGLTAAYRLTTATLLDKDVELEVHLFEKSESLGMDAHSINISLSTPDPLNDVFRVDVPMRSFLDGYYPHLIKLYKHVGIEFQRANYSYSLSKLSFASGKRKMKTAVLYNGNSGLSGISMPSDTYDSNESCSRFRRDTTFGAWIEGNCPRNPLARLLRFDTSWNLLCYDILLPLFSGICTASREEILNHPVLDFLDCIWAGLLGHHYVAANNVQDVVERLSGPIRYVHTNCAIASMSPDSNDSGKITLTTSQSGKTFSGFSHVIFACQASAVPPILSSYLDNLPSSSKQKVHVKDAIECTKTFKYRTTVTINHTDESFLSKDSRDRRDLNLVDSLPDTYWPLERSELCRDYTCTMATHIVTRPSPGRSIPAAIYQTTNPMFPPRPESVLSVTYLERAVLTVKSKRALQDLSTEERKWWQSYAERKTHLGRLQGCGRRQEKSVPGIWFCGSYASAGIPLLEGCVVSAKDVVDQGIFASEGIRFAGSEW
ncbi:hypothetical protein SCHPADRAFT_923586 [Schizopora paradoxa]|uniref:FAD/NAD(P)-binding domain-containing protein n=1 Tax=Schizopora paradoxa TaxID=27342 RepID=A0A0H2STI7_9AGAM|nr:hypothetical protein SCHPADRAFT_923586 [Schizopora paradoxa]